MAVEIFNDGVEKRIIFASPFFRIWASDIQFFVSVRTFVKKGDEWVHLPAANKELSPITINNSMTINPVTGLRVFPTVDEEGNEIPAEGVGAYNYIMGINAGQLGVTGPEDSVYSLVAAQVEGFLMNNNLVNV